MFNLPYVKKNLDFEDYVFLESVDSTNEYLAKLIKKKSSSVLVVAEVQTNGRGRFNRKWSSSKGGLYFSFVQKTEKLNYPPQLFPIACSIGVYNFLRSAGVLSLSYRWPNDILANNKKISGILLEIIGDSIIAGIGLNVNIEEFPDDISKIATSTFLMRGRKYDLSETLVSVIKGIKSVKDSKEILDFLSNSKMIGKRVKFTFSSKEIIGKVSGFQETGEIEIEVNGKKETFIAGEISFLREEE